MGLRRSLARTAWLTLAAVLGASGIATAADQPRQTKLVLLILDRPSDPIAERLRANIAGLGLTVLSMEGWRDPDRADHMEEAAREQHASASIRILPSRRGVEVWMADETSGRALVRQLIVDNSASGPDENAVAMQLLEVLRTGLLVEPGEKPPTLSPPPPAPPPPAIERPAQVAAEVSCASVLGCPRLQAGLGPLVASGGTGLALQAWLSAQMTLGPAAALAFDGSVPIRSSGVSGPEGSASISATMIGLAALMRLDDRQSRLSAAAGVGVSFLRIAAEGTAAQPMVARAPAASTGAGLIRADVACDIARWMRLTLRVTAGVALQRVDIHLAGNDAASWGRFFAAGVLMLDAGRR